MGKRNLVQLISILGFECIAGKNLDDKYPESAYVSDLLSDVMGNAGEGMIWITSQIHRNILAVASLKDLSAIVIAGNRKPEKEVLECAEQEGVVVFLSHLPAFDTAGLIYLLLADKI